jgi:hypothetical protein
MKKMMTKMKFKLTGKDRKPIQGGGKCLDLTDPKQYAANKEIVDTLSAALNESPPVPTLFTKKMLAGMKTFRDAQNVALVYRTLFGLSGFPGMKRDLATLVKSFSQEEVQVLLGGSALQPFGKTLAAVVVAGWQVLEVSDCCPIVTALNLTKTSATFVFVNVSKCSHRVEMGNFAFDPVAFTLKPQLMSSDGWVCGDPIEEYVVNASGKPMVLPELITDGSGGIRFETHVETIPLHSLPFSLGKIWEGLIDIRVKLIVDGEEHETNANLLFDADLES